MHELNIYPDQESLNGGLAQKIIYELETVLKTERRKLTLALSGGRTPQGLLAELLARYAGSKVWKQLQVFWVDERHVPFDHPDSNYGNSRSYLEALGIPLDQIHPMGADPDTQTAAQTYHQLILALEAQRGPEVPLFDLVLLGIGPDGHMASLFPGTDHLHDELFCKAAIQPESGQARISLTLPALNRCDCCLFMASGGSKARIISTVIQEGPDPRYPASLIKPPKPVLWYLDRAAAEGLKAK